jgi:hypothetical protein
MWRIVLVFLFTGIVLFFAEAKALDKSFKFQQHQNQFKQGEYSTVWNSSAQEASVRINLDMISVPDDMSTKTVNMSTAKSVEVIALTDTFALDACSVVSQWNFEYQPGLPTYLLEFTLKGAGCQEAAQALQFIPFRLRFLSITDQTVEPIDASVDISP